VPTCPQRAGCEEATLGATAAPRALGAGQARYRRQREKAPKKTKYTAELGFLVLVQLLHIAGNSLFQRLKGKGVG
jgi:hypothetical protein